MSVPVVEDDIERLGYIGAEVISDFPDGYTIEERMCIHGRLRTTDARLFGLHEEIVPLATSVVMSFTKH